MSELHLTAKQCRHGSWHPHNAFQMPDGEVVDDPEGSCRGGTIHANGRTFHVGHVVARFLDDITATDHTEGET